MRARLWKLGVLALILAGTVVGSYAQTNYQTFEYWESANGTATGTGFTGVSKNTAVGNYSYDSGNTYNGFVYNLNGGSYSALDLYTTTYSVQVNGIQGQSVVGTYSSDGTDSYGFVRDLSHTGVDSVLSLGAGTKALGISGNYVLGTNAAGKYIVYDTSKQADQITILPIDESVFLLTGIGNHTIVGYRNDGSATYGISYTFTTDPADGGDPTTINVGTNSLFTAINGIDKQGTIVGSYSTSEDGSNGVAFVKNANGDVTEVSNSEDTTDTTLTGVDGTTVVGTAKQNNKPVGVLVVPEPTTYALIALGLFVMAISRCKSRRFPQA